MVFQTTEMEFVLIDPNQTGKSDTSNEGVTGIAKAMAGELTKDMTAESSPYTLPYDSGEGEDKSGLHVQIYRFTGTPGAPKSIHHPAVRHRFVMINDTDDEMTMLVSGQTGVTLSPGTRRELYCNGTDVEDVTSDRQIDMMSWVPGSPAGSSEVLRLYFQRYVRFEADFLGSLFKSVVAADAEAIFELFKNAGSIGTATFAAASSTAVFDVASATDFAPGDYISIVAPATPDANLLGLSITLVGTKL